MWFCFLPSSLWAHVCSVSVLSIYCQIMKNMFLISGGCGPDVLCLTNYDPVCGTNNQTYPNTCNQQCAGVGLGCLGYCPCPDPDCVSACPEVDKQVCGVDGFTYTNSCTADCRGVDVQCQGECPCNLGEMYLTRMSGP